MPDELPPDNPFAAMLRGSPAQQELPPDNPFSAMLNPQRTIEHTVVPNYLKNMLASEQTWDSIAPKLKEQFGVDPSQYEQDYRLNEARAVQKGEGVGTVEQFMRKSVPGFSELQGIHENKKYREASDRYRAGQLTPEDAATMARFERLQEIDKQAGPIIGALGGIPKIAGEFAAAGPILRGVPTVLGRAAATTALVPSMGLYSGAQERAMRQGGSASDLKNLAPAAALSVLNAAVLGQVQRQFGGMKGFLPRVAAQGGVGVLEQAGADSIAGLADEVLPEQYKLGTRYGTIGNLARGEYGEAIKHATGQLLTFSLFAAAHGREPGAVIDRGQKVLDDAFKAGLSPEEAAKKLHDSNLAEAAEQVKPPAPEGKKRPSWLPEQPKVEEAPVETKAPEFATEPRARADELTQQRNASDQRVADAERNERNLGQSAGLLNAGESVKRQHKAAKDELSAARAERKAIQGQLDAARDELMRQPTKASPETPPGAEVPASQSPAQPEIVDSERSGGPESRTLTRAERIAALGKPTEPNQEHTPATQPGDLHDAIRAAGLEARADKPFGETVGTIGEGQNQIILRLRPDVKSVQVDFGETGKTGEAVKKQLPGPATMGLGRNLLKLAEKLREKGLAIDYKVAEGPNGEKRHEIFSKVLTKAGFKMEAERGASGEFVWRPRDEKVPIQTSEDLNQVRDAIKRGEESIHEDHADAVRSGLDRASVQRANELALQKASAVVAAEAAGAGVPRPAASEAAAGVPAVHRATPAVGNQSAPAAAKRGTAGSNKLTGQRRLTLAEREEIGSQFVPAKTRRVNVREELARQKQIVASGSAIDKVFARASIADLQRALELGRTEYDSALPPPPGFRSGEKNGRPVWYRIAPKYVDESVAEPAKQTPAALKKQQEVNLFKPITLQGRLEKDGGISESSAINAGLDLGKKNDSPTRRLFKKNGGRHIEDVINELQRSGDLPDPILANRHGADLLMEKLERGDLAADQGSDVHWQKEHDKWIVKQMAQEKDSVFETLQREGADPAEIAASLKAISRQAEVEARQEVFGDEGGGAQPAAAPAKPNADIPNHGEQPGLFDHAEFDFGANAVERIAGESGGLNGSPNPVAKAVVDFLKGEEGHFWFPSKQGFSDAAKELYRRVQVAKDHVNDNIRELAGSIAPRATRFSENISNAIARVAKSREFVEVATPNFIDRVMGPHVGDADRMLYGAALVESRLRYMEDAFRHVAAIADRDAASARKAGDMMAATSAAQRAAEYLDKANKVISIVGPDSPLTSEAEYHRVAESKEMKELLDRWKAVMVPEMEGNYRKAMGLEDTDDIKDHTQIPGLPVNLLATSHGDPDVAGAVFAGGLGRGNLRNVRLKQFGFAKEATGAAEGYVVDLGKIIENSLNHGVRRAAHMNLVKTIIDEQQGVRGRPGMQPDGMTKIDFVWRGSDDTLYVNKAFEPEVRKSLAPDRPFQIPFGISKGLGFFTKASLMSTVEFVYHSKNLLTMLSKPGMFRGLYDTVLQSTSGAGRENLAKRYVELARIGATKGKGFESGMLWGGKADPTAWMSKFLDTLDYGMRLSADTAFEKMKTWKNVVTGEPLIDPSERNKRDFINQLGQYGKRAQNDLVVFLRDTGIGPFATAGSNYIMQSLRSLTMNPGVTATSPGGQLQLRAAVLAKTAGLLAATALANYMMWGRADGDDSTPIGGLKVAQGNGKTSYLNVPSLIGVGRGLRETGLLALAEGQRKGEKPGVSLSKAEEDVFHAFVHPAVGPAVQFGYMAKTGRNMLGNKVADKTPSEMSKAEQVRKGMTPDSFDSTAWENMKAAIRNANPSYAVLSGFERPPTTAEPAPHPLFGRQGAPLARIVGGQASPEFTASEQASKLLGPFGFKTRKTRTNEEQLKAEEKGRRAGR